MMEKSEILEISKKVNLSEKEVENRIKRILEECSKPSLQNIDTVYPLKDKYIGFFDE